MRTLLATAGATSAGRASSATTCASRTGRSTGTTTTSRSTTTCRPRSQVWGKYSRMGAERHLAAALPRLRRRAHRRDHRQMATFGDTWTISPTMVFDATLALRKMTHHSQAPDSRPGQLRPRHSRDSRDERRRATSAATRAMPACRPSSLRGCAWGVRLRHIGNINGWDPVDRDERTYAFASNLTKLKGAHEFRFGYSVNKLRMNHWQPELGYGPRGLDAARQRHRARATGAQAREHLQRLRRVPDGPGGRGGHERAERADDHARVAAQLLRARSVAGERQADARPRSPLRVLPARCTRADRGIEKILGADDLASARALAEHPSC